LGKGSDMATTRISGIKPSEIKYIKLGAGGCWEQECIEKTQTLRLGFDAQDHAQCLAGNWSAIWRDFRRRGFDKSKSTRFANEIKQFYESDEKVLWVTFYDGRLWWCFSEPVITLLPDHTKTRPAEDGSAKALPGKRFLWTI